MNSFKSLIKDLELKVKEIIDNPEEIKTMLDGILDKLKTNEILMEIGDDLRIFYRLMKDWVDGNYLGIDNKSLVTILAGLIYIASPLDLISDFIPLGLVDDIIVFIYISKKIKKEIEKYKEWLDSAPGGFYEDIGEGLKDEDIFER